MAISHVDIDCRLIIQIGVSQHYLSKPYFRTNLCSSSRPLQDVRGCEVGMKDWVACTRVPGAARNNWSTCTTKNRQLRCMIGWRAVGHGYLHVQVAQGYRTLGHTEVVPQEVECTARSTPEPSRMEWSFCWGCINRNGESRRSRQKVIAALDDESYPESWKSCPPPRC